MNVQSAYTEWSSTYDSDRNLTRDLDAMVTRETLGGLRFDSILELGCGTGKNTAFLATIGNQVRALDFSEGMINRAREKNQSSNVTFAVADLTLAWPCADRSADLIVCNLVLEHIRDLTHIFSEAKRALTGGGQFLISELHPFRQYQGTVASFQREQTTTEIPAFVHHISDFTNAATANGFQIASLKECWHDEDTGKPPRLVSFAFIKKA